MARTLCVWFPDWPLRRTDSPPDRPRQVVDAAGLVVAADPAVLARGVRPGMTRREAEALAPEAVTLFSDPDAEAVAFEPVAHAIEAVVPRIEMSAPGLVYLPIAGAVRYYGDEQSLLEEVVASVETVASGGRFGLADGPFAARMAAVAAEEGPVIVADTAGFLAGIDISALGVEELVETFRWLGIGTLGGLAELPRAAVASRFGHIGLEAHRIACGEDRQVRPRRIPVEAVVEEGFESPLQGVEQAAFAARALARRLLDSVASSGARPHRVDVEVIAASGATRTRTWRCSHPFSEAELAERVRWQLRAWIESEGVPGGVARIRLVPADLSDRGRQLRMGEDAASDQDAYRALGRAQTLVGPDAVLQAAPRGGRDPAERVHWRRWGEDGPSAAEFGAPWPGRLPEPSPALVPPDPRPVEIEWDGGFPVRVRLGSRWEPVLSWAGPWRRTGRWWEGDTTADRYQVVTSAGAFLCEVRRGRSFLVGVYD